MVGGVILTYMRISLVSGKRKRFRFPVALHSVIETVGTLIFHTGVRTVYEEATGNSIVCCLNARQHASTTSKCNAMQRWVFYMTLQKQNGKIQVSNMDERL